MRSLMRVGCFLIFVSAVSAQVPGTGSIELGGFVGATYGFGNYGEMGGGNFSYAVNKYLLPYAEFSYFPYLERQITGTISGTNNPYTVDYSLAATDFHGGVHIRVPIKESRIVPYGVFGVGRLGYSSGAVAITYKDSSGATHSAGSLQSPGGGRAAINFGGGLRYYAHPRFGFRVEVKGYKPFGNVGLGYTNPFLKVEGGVFLQLR